RSARSFQWSARCIEPNVHSLHQITRQFYVIPLKEDKASTCLRLLDGAVYLLDQLLAAFIRGMRFTSEQNLYWSPRVIDQRQQTVEILQNPVSTLVCSETPRKTDRQRIGIQPCTAGHHLHWVNTLVQPLAAHTFT